MMAGRSYKRINYTLRPAKAIERRLMCDIVRRAVVFHPYTHYRYIGMGSLYFVDFAMLHRATGIENMVSIEFDTSEAVRERFWFNRPFECVSIEWTESTAYLHSLPRDPQPTILWLDYDFDLNSVVLADIDEMVSVVSSGSLYFVTVRVQTQSSDLSCKREYFASAYDPDTLKFISDEDLDDKLGVARVSARLLRERILVALSARNVGVPLAERLRFTPLLSLQYEDGVQMFTLGGVFTNEEHYGRVADFLCGNIPFVEADNIAPKRLRVPLLTSKEVKHLSCAGREAVAGIPPSDLDDFLEIRRYYPHYFDVEW